MELNNIKAEFGPLSAKILSELETLLQQHWARCSAGVSWNSSIKIKSYANLHPLKIWYTAFYISLWRNGCNIKENFLAVWV